jgi:hypothetical protein
VDAGFDFVVLADPTLIALGGAGDKLKMAAIAGDWTNNPATCAKFPGFEDLILV